MEGKPQEFSFHFVFPVLLIFPQVPVKPSTIARHGLD